MKTGVFLRNLYRISKWITFLGIILFYLQNVTYLMASENTYEAAIKITPNKGILHIEGVCSSKVKDVLSYELVSERIGRSGRSKSVQSGTLSISPGEKKSITRVSLSGDPGDHFEFYLKILKDGSIVAEHQSSFILD